jgi:hypothetical protein
MKLIKIKRWGAIALIMPLAVLLFVWLGNEFFHYYAKNLMYVNVWFNRLKGGDVFYMEGIKIKTPEYCATRPHKELTKISFECAISPIELESVNVYKQFKEIAELKSDSEKFDESSDYVHMVLGPKQGLKTMTVSFYHLKRQNVLVASNSQELAQKFADLLLRYDFRVESMSLEANPDVQ